MKQKFQIIVGVLLALREDHILVQTKQDNTVNAKHSTSNRPATRSLNTPGRMSEKLKKKYEKQRQGEREFDPLMD